MKKTYILSALFLTTTGMTASSETLAAPPTSLRTCLTSPAALCSEYTFGLPVIIDTTSIGPALTVTGGNVGIGIPFPAQPLSVLGIIESTSGGFKFPDGSVQTTAATSSGGGGGSSQWITNGNNISYSTGSVAVGTQTPTSPLTVLGTIESSQGGFKFPDGTVQATAAVNTPAAPPQWAPSGSNISYEAGNVAIGTSSATDRLTVAGTIHTISGGIKFPDGSVQTTASTGSGGGESQWVNSPTGIGYLAGNVGIGTTTPDANAKIDVRGNIFGGSRVLLANDNSGGDGRGSIWIGSRLLGATEPTNLALGIVSSGDGSVSALNFMTQGQNRIYVDASGRVGVGTTSAISKFQVMDLLDGLSTGVQVRPFHIPGQAAGTMIQATDADTSVKRTLALNAEGGAVGIGTLFPDNALTVNGNASKAGGGSWATYSDARLKTVESKFKRGIEALEKLQPVSYHYNDNNPAGVKNEGSHVGFVAQEVQKAIPEAVSQNDNGYLMVNNDPILWTMVNAIKGAHAENEKLRKEVSGLRGYICEKDPAAEICR